MKKYHEDLMIDIVNEAMSECSDKFCGFSLQTEAVKSDFESLFGEVVRRRLMKLIISYRNDNRFPLEQMSEVLEECTHAFSDRIEGAINEALDAAEKSFMDDLVILEGFLLSFIADEVSMSA